LVRGVLICLTACLLPAGCATLDTSGDGAESRPAVNNSQQLGLWSKRQRTLSTITQWQLKGRMAVRTSDQSGTATVVWDRSNDRDELDIFGPFGSGHVKISADASGASLTDSKQTINRASSIRDLLYQEAGWPVPFGELKFWMLGAPVPAARAEWKLDDSGRLVWLRQSGWIISFSDYQDRDGIELPRKLRLEAQPGTASLNLPDGQTSNELVVKLVINTITSNWMSNHGDLSSAGEN